MPIQPGVMGRVDDPHAAAAELREHLIRTERGDGSEGHARAGL